MLWILIKQYKSMSYEYLLCKRKKTFDNIKDEYLDKDKMVDC